MADCRYAFFARKIVMENMSRHQKKRSHEKEQKKANEPGIKQQSDIMTNATYSPQLR